MVMKFEVFESETCGGFLCQSVPVKFRPKKSLKIGHQLCGTGNSQHDSRESARIIGN